MAIINDTSKMVTNNGGGSGSMSKFMEFGPAPGHCRNLVGTVKDDNTSYTSIEFTWEDPILEGVPYGGTKLVIKEDSKPVNSSDGIVAIDYSLKDKYKNSPFKYNLPKGKIGERLFYASLYPYSSLGSINEIGACNENFTVNMTEPTYEFNKKSDKAINTTLFSPYVNCIWNDKLYSIGKPENTEPVLSSISLSLIDNENTLIEPETYSIPSEDFVFNSFVQPYSMIIFNNKLIFSMTAVNASDVANRYKVIIFEFDGTSVSKIGESIPFKEIRKVNPIVISGQLYFFGNIGTTSKDYICAKIERDILCSVPTELPDNYKPYESMCYETNDYSKLWLSGDGVGKVFYSIRENSFSYENDKIIITETKLNTNTQSKDSPICRFDKWILYSLLDNTSKYICGYNLETNVKEQLATNANKLTNVNDMIIDLQKDKKVLTINITIGSDNLYHVQVFKYEETII